MQIPKNNKTLIAAMAVVIVAAIVMSYVFYPDLGKEKEIEWPETTEVTIEHIGDGVVATYNGSVLTDGQVIIVPFNHDLTIDVTIAETGTMHWSYITTGYSGGSGSGSEYGHAGDTLQVYVMNTWDDTINVNIWFD